MGRKKFMKKYLLEVCMNSISKYNSFVSLDTSYLISNGFVKLWSNADDSTWFYVGTHVSNH